MIRHYENYNEDGSDHWEEEDGFDSIMEYVKFYRKCLRLAKKFWNTDTEKLDAMYESDDDSPSADDED